jgi:uncharacterized membrane protein (UPF0127 family)
MRSRSASRFGPFVLCMQCILVMLGLMGCVSAARETITLKAAGTALTVEVARTEAEREHGLMGRTDLGPRNGMIFVFDRDDHLTFWMKDTPTPLSIAFLSPEGRVLEIADMQPFSEKIIRSRLSARYALEMRQGAFADLGVSEGDMIQLPAGFP